MYKSETQREKETQRERDFHINAWLMSRLVLQGTIWKYSNGKKGRSQGRLS